MKNINDYFVLYKLPNQLIFGYGESRARRQSLEPKTVYLFRRNPGTSIKNSTSLANWNLIFSSFKLMITKKNHKFLG